MREAQSRLLHRESQSGSAISSRPRWSTSPVGLMLLTVYLACIVISAGQLAFDTERRLQATHWLWTSSDSILAEDKPVENRYDLNIAVGASGHPHYGYGIGQSLVMLPADMLGTLVANLIVKNGGSNSEYYKYRIRRVVVSYVVFPLIGVFTAYLLQLFFVALGLDLWASISAVGLSFVATRWLDATRAYQEMGLHFACFLAGGLCLILWRKMRQNVYAWGAGAAFCVVIVTRIISVIDIVIICSAFTILMLVERGMRVWRELFGLYARLLLCLLVGLFVDRVYHFLRFGEWASTYAGLYFQQVAQIRQRSLEPLRGAFNDPSFPWTTPIWDGVIGAFVSPKWGVVWFDCMVVLALYLFVRFFRLWDKLTKTYFCAGIIYLVVYAFFYGRYYEPAGWGAWGNRYLEVPAIFLSVLGVFMLFRSWSVQRVADRAVSLILCGASVIVQLASGIFSSSLEIVQLQHGCGSQWIVLQRFRNIATVLREGGPGYDCLSTDQHWMWDLNVFAGTLARTAAKTAAERQFIWSVWAAGLVVVLILVGWLLIVRRRSKAPGAGSAS